MLLANDGDRQDGAAPLTTETSVASSYCSTTVTTSTGPSLQLQGYNVTAETSTSVLPLCITVALSDDGRSYRPVHVVVNIMNK